MTIVTIEEALDHLRADGDDVAGVDIYLAAAEAACIRVLNRNVYLFQEDLDDADDPSGILVFPDFHAAVLLTLGFLWVHRDGVSGSDLPAAALALLRAHRWIPAP